MHKDMEGLTRVRIGTDITIRARLIDSGVAYDFSQAAPVAVRLLSLSQNSLVRDLEYATDPDDGTVLVVTWRASGQCYTGDYRLIVSAELSGRTATFDAPAFTLVRLLKETGTADQPDGGVSDIGVTLEVESIDISLVSQILKECREATEAAKEAAEAAADIDEDMKKSEAERQQSELERVSAEEARKAAEIKRQEDTATAISTAETAAQNAESSTEGMEELYNAVSASEAKRVKAEAARVQAEMKRKAAELLREQAEEKRQEDTAQAVSDAKAAAQAANDAVAGMAGTYQKKTDNALETASKQVTGAINEVNGKAPLVTQVPELSADYVVPANATSREHIYEIAVGATAYGITGAEGVKWADGTPPEVSANTTVVVSVINNLAVWGTF